MTEAEKKMKMAATFQIESEYILARSHLQLTVYT